MIVLWHILLSSIPLLSILIPNVNGVYVPRVYGSVYPNPLTCHFITETGEKHQIFLIGDVYMFGRVYVLDAQNARLINTNENHSRLCFQSEMERLEDPRIIGPNEHQFHVHGRETNALAILSMGDDEKCKIKGEEGLNYPIYSCQTTSSTPAGDPNPCPPAGHYFYLEESMNKQSSADTMPKLIVFTATDEQIQLCGGGSQPTGFSEYVVSKKTWTETLQSSTGTNTQMQEAERQQVAIVDDIERGHVDTINRNQLIYKWLSFLIKGLKCDSIKIHSNTHNSVTAQLRNSGYQIKLVCEDMKGMLVQISKGNLDNGTLSYNDLNAKMDETVEKLKKQYGIAFATVGGEQARLRDSTFIDVLKHVGQQLTKIKLELLGSQLTDPAMKTRLKAYAHTLLYSLEKIQKYFSHEPIGPVMMWSSILAFAIVFVMIYLVKSIPVMAVLVFLSLGLGANAYIMVIKYGNIGRGDPQQQQQQQQHESVAVRLAKYNSYIAEEVYNGNKEMVVNLDEASTSSAAGAMTVELQGDCGICLGEFNTGEKIKRLPCNEEHFFHAHCIDEWAKTNHLTCPLCRKDILKEYAKKHTHSSHTQP